MKIKNKKFFFAIPNIVKRSMAGMLCLLVIGLFISSSCEKDDQGNRVTYYKTVGEGYIVERDNNKPIKGIKITVISRTCSFTGNDTWGLDWCSRPYTQETFTTDENGYYQLRFAKRVGIYKVENYRFELNHYPALSYPPLPALFWYWETSQGNTLFPGSFVYMYPSEIKDKKVIMFDTIKYYY